MDPDVTDSVLKLLLFPPLVSVFWFDGVPLPAKRTLEVAAEKGLLVVSTFVPIEEFMHWECGFGLGVNPSAAACACAAIDTDAIPACAVAAADAHEDAPRVAAVAARVRVATPRPVSAEDVDEVEDNDEER